jgi:hypothetical protein
VLPEHDELVVNAFWNAGSIPPGSSYCVTELRVSSTPLPPEHPVNAVGVVEVPVHVRDCAPVLLATEMTADVLNPDVDATSTVALGRLTLFDPLATSVDCLVHAVKVV